MATFARRTGAGADKPVFNGLRLHRAALVALRPGRPRGKYRSRSTCAPSTMRGSLATPRLTPHRSPAMPMIDPAALKPLSAAILSDVMDSLGLMRQAMKPFVRPLDDSLVLVGRARTGLYMPAYEVKDGENPYEVEIALVDDLKPGDVVVLACNGPTERIAPWGELLSTAATARGAAGCVIDGLVRDVRQIREMRFPVFHGGIGPLDTKGRAHDAARRAGGMRRRGGRQRRPGVRRRGRRGGHPAGARA